MLETLKHELMHVWLYENGHKNQNNDEIFDYEDVCELVALSNNFINYVVDIYKSSKFWRTCCFFEKFWKKFNKSVDKVKRLYYNNIKLRER